jgi:hypothetical protein
MVVIQLRTANTHRDVQRPVFTAVGGVYRPERAADRLELVLRDLVAEEIGWRVSFFFKSAFSLRLVKLRLSSWDIASSRTEDWAEAMGARETSRGRLKNTKRVKPLE